jgi:DNA-binding MarR family transcriptional regulator
VVQFPPIVVSHTQYTTTKWKKSLVTYELVSKRIKDTPKSRLLRLELTDKGREMLKIKKYSDCMNLSLSDFTIEDRQELYSVLSRMYTKLQ